MENPMNMDDLGVLYPYFRKPPFVRCDVRHGAGICGTASGASCAASLVKRGPVPSAHDPLHGASRIRRLHFRRVSSTKTLIYHQRSSRIIKDHQRSSKITERHHFFLLGVGMAAQLQYRLWLHGLQGKPRMVPHSCTCWMATDHQVSSSCRQICSYRSPYFSNYSILCCYSS